MKRLGGLFLVLVLVFAACGGNAPEPAEGGEGLAALDQTETDGGAGAGDGGAGKNKDKAGSEGDKTGSSGKERPKQKSGDDSSSEEEGSAPTDTDSSNGSEGSKPKQRSPQATAAVPIPAGTHSYDTDGSTTVSGNESRMPKRTTLSARAPRGEEQIQTRDLRDSEGNGTVVETGLLYRQEGVYLTYVKITATFPGGFTDVRELHPSEPELIAPTGAKPGATTAFTMNGSGTRADVDVKAKRLQDVTVGSSTLTALVVDTRIVFSGAIEGQQSSTTWFWGKHAMALREAVATDVTNGPIRFQSQYQAVLTKLP